MNTNISLDSKITIAQLEKEVLAKLAGLAEAVLGIPFRDISESQLTDLLVLEMNTRIDSLTVFAQCTRQVENFNPNSYSVTEVIDLKPAYEAIIQQVSCIESTKEKIKRYVDLKSTMYKLISYKYDTTEQFLRNLLKTSEEKDGVHPLGRFKHEG